MCITISEMNQKMEKRKSLQMQLKKMEDDIKKLDLDIIEYLMENLNDCLTTNDKGKEILQFIGDLCKATYSPQERETLDKADYNSGCDHYKHDFKSQAFPLFTGREVVRRRETDHEKYHRISKKERH